MMEKGGGRGSLLAVQHDDDDEKSTADLNSKFSFSQTGYNTKAKEHYYLLIAGGRTNGFMLFASEMRCHQLHPRFEPKPLYPFPKTIIVTSHASIKIFVNLVMIERKSTISILNTFTNPIRNKIFIIYHEPNCNSKNINDIRMHKLFQTIYREIRMAFQLLNKQR